METDHRRQIDMGDSAAKFRDKSGEETHQQTAGDDRFRSR